MTEMEAVIKGLEETRADVRELQSAMVGSVDGSRKGFAQQLLAVMKEMEGFTGRILTIETKVIRFEGAVTGAQKATIVFWSVISLAIGIAITLLVKK